MSPESPQARQPYASVELQVPAHHVHELTGLPNRIALAEMTAEAVAIMPGNFAAIAGDVDNLKDVNEEGGHGGGDEYLKTVAEVIDHILRKTDRLGIVTHVSGDEFVFLLPGVNNDEQVEAAIHRVQASLDEYGIDMSLAGLVHEVGQEPDALLDAADNKLLATKIETKLQRYASPEKRQAIREIIRIAQENDISLRDIPLIQDYI